MMLRSIAMLKRLSKQPMARPMPVRQVDFASLHSEELQVFGRDLCRAVQQLLLQLLAPTKPMPHSARLVEPQRQCLRGVGPQQGEQQLQGWQRQGQVSQPPPFRVVPQRR